MVLRRVGVTNVQYGFRKVSLSGLASKRSPSSIYEKIADCYLYYHYQEQPILLL